MVKPINTSEEKHAWNQMVIEEYEKSKIKIVETKISEPINLGKPDCPVWNNDLQCYWQGFRVRDEGHLALNLSERNCCDPVAAVRLARKVMPKVFHIDVFSGNNFDFSICENGHYEWSILIPKNKHPYRGSKP